MGWNTTVIVLNDALHLIAEDPLFGRKLAEAIMHLSVDPKPQDVRAGYHVNAATVIETHHMDFKVMVEVGHNMGVVIPEEELRLRFLKRRSQRKRT